MAVEATTTTEGAELTLLELAQAYCNTPMDESDLRLRKWVQAFGHVSAWAITSEQLETAAQARREAGDNNATVNRDLSTLGSVYR